MAVAAPAPALTPVEASCPEGPSFTPEQRLWKGTIRTTYTIGADGSLGKIEHETYRMRPPDGAIAAIEDWLHSCRFKAARAGETPIPQQAHPALQRGARKSRAGDHHRVQQSRAALSHRCTGDRPACQRHRDPFLRARHRRQGRVRRVEE